MAVVTRSRLSRTPASGRPTTTIWVFVSGPPELLTSTSTETASTPTTAVEKTRANMSHVDKMSRFFVKGNERNRRPSVEPCIAVNREATTRIMNIRGIFNTSSGFSMKFASFF